MVHTWAAADFLPGEGAKNFQGGARTYFLHKKHTIFLKKLKNILLLAAHGYILFQWPQRYNIVGISNCWTTNTHNCVVGGQQGRFDAGFKHK
jgi:hypothetical protein